MSNSRLPLSIGERLMLLSGGVLIVVAVTLLLLIGLLVYQIFYEPESVKLVQFLMENIKLSDRAFFGHIGGSEFYINMADPVKYFLYLFALIIILSIVVNILRGIMSAGITLIKSGKNSPDNMS